MTGAFGKRCFQSGFLFAYLSDVRLDSDFSRFIYAGCALWGCFSVGVSYIAKIGDVGLVGSAPGGTRNGLLSLCLGRLGGSADTKG